MKKLLIILSIFAFIGCDMASAQGINYMHTRRLGIYGFTASGSCVTATSSNGVPTPNASLFAVGAKALDTLTNTGDTAYFYFNAANMKNGSFEIVANRISGTCVSTATLQRSNDGINWGNTAAGDTINLSPAANAVKTGVLTTSRTDVGFYRWMVVGHNTTYSIQLRAYVCSRRD